MAFDMTRRVFDFFDDESAPTRRKTDKPAQPDNDVNLPEQQEACVQKLMLFDAYQIATEQHSIALTELNRRIGTCSRSQYVEMYRKVEVLRQDASALHQELEWHIHQHGC